MVLFPIKMNHNIVPELFTEHFFKSFFLFQMQDLFKSFQLCRAPAVVPQPSPVKVTANKKCGARDLAWQAEEDEILTSHVKLQGAKNWSKIAHKINYQVFNGNMLRKGKHCRERWFNHLNPNLNKSDWNEEEDRMLVDLQKEHGNAWSLIARCLPGRTENSVRNRWNSLFKKQGKKEDDV
jgi:hypothetical protein